jgi:hypothetical protein
MQQLVQEPVQEALPQGFYTVERIIERRPAEIEPIEHPYDYKIKWMHY